MFYRTMTDVFTVAR